MSKITWTPPGSITVDGQVYSSKYARIWHLTNRATHWRKDAEKQIEALDQIEIEYDDDTRDHYLSTLTEVIRSGTLVVRIQAMRHLARNFTSSDAEWTIDLHEERLERRSKMTELEAAEIARLRFAWRNKDLAQRRTSVRPATIDTLHQATQDVTESLFAEHLLGGKPITIHTLYQAMQGVTEPEPITPAEETPDPVGSVSLALRTKGTESFSLTHAIQQHGAATVLDGIRNLAYTPIPTTITVKK